MASTYSPTSLQLRFALASAGASRKSPPRLSRTQLWTRSRTQRRRFEVLALSSDSNSDGFSGWSGTDGGGGESPLGSEKKTKFPGGAIGVGVAGVVLAVGIALAALSLRKPSSSGVKHMEPLTTQQEESLLVGEKDVNVGDDKDEGQSLKKDEASNPEDSGTGTNKDSSSFSEVDVPSENIRFGDDDLVSRGIPVDDVKNTSNDIDATDNVSDQDNLEARSNIEDESVETETESKSFVLVELDDTDVSSAASYDRASNPSDGAADHISKNEENLVDVGLIPNSDDVPSNISLDNKNVSGQTPNQNPISHVLDELVSPNVPFSSRSISISETHTASGFSAENVTITNEIFEVSDDSLVLAEQNSITIEGNKISEGGTSVTPVPDPGSLLQNEQYTNIYSEINRSTSESTKLGTSFSSAGIPAPSVVFSALQVLPGKVVIPAVVDQVQGQALAALQVLKVIETDVQPSDLCTRREYARWLVTASSILSRNTISKVYPAMYIENVTELAFDDITPKDQDFSAIQGLAEAGIISSKLSRDDMLSSGDENLGPLFFSPESPLSRQDLVTWKMALEKRHLPDADRKTLYELSGYIDTNKIHPDACPALVADLTAGEQGITALAFGYTRLFQPDKPVTKAQAAIALAVGEAFDSVSEELARIEAETMAENAVAAHNALVAQVEKDINANFEKELFMEREKINAVEKMAKEATRELEKLRAEREENSFALLKERAAIESEMEMLSRLRHEVEDQLQSLMSNKVEISYEKERVSKLRKEAEEESQEIERLQYELEVERKALSLARSWAEDEAKRAREQAKALEEARDRWERHGIKVVVDEDLREESLAGVTWVDATKQFSVDETVSRAETLTDKLKTMAKDLRGKSRATIDTIIQKIALLISTLKEWAFRAGKRAEDLRNCAISKASESTQKLQQSTCEFGSTVKESAKRVAGDCRDGVEKLTQKFVKT